MDGCGLLGGLTVEHIRMLTENPWNGGGGYTIHDVGQMTLDQIWHRLCDIDMLKAKGKRVKRMNALAAGAVAADKEGQVKGVARDGTPMRATVKGVSKAQRLRAEAEAARRAQDRKPAKPKRR